MSYQLYAYRPAIGVAVCKQDAQWLVLDIHHGSADPKLIDVLEADFLIKHLALIDISKSFPSIDRLVTFIQNEQISALQQYDGANIASSIEEDLAFMGREGVMDWLQEISQSLNQESLEGINPLVVKENLSILAQHPLYEADPEILAVLNPLRNAWERKFSIPQEILAHPSQKEAADLSEIFPLLNGNSFAMQRSVQMSVRSIMFA